MNSQPTAAHLTLLEARFGHSSFRPMQWEIIRSVMEQKQDHCAVMATGYGKSLLYQFPSVFLNRLTVVISPFISLMQDQGMSLSLANIPACFLGSAQTVNVIPDIQAGKYRLVYMTPEFLTEDMGKDLLELVLDQLVLIAVDEADCISKWNHNFRPAFRELHVIRDLCPNVPILTVSATATPNVRKDIVTGLKLRSPLMTCLGLDRPNLSFHVKPKSSVNFVNDIVAFIKRCGDGSVIIYCLTRAETELIVKKLKSKRISCEAYHAGMELDQRKTVHERFVRGQLKVIVATNAFGMGIDKANVRLVIHDGASKDIESYYREVGRAGRDGQPAQCVMYWDEEDFRMHEYFREKNRQDNDQWDRLLELSSKMRQYLKSQDCRRKFILNYLEGNDNSLPPRRDCCDICAVRYKDLPLAAPTAVPSGSPSSPALSSTVTKAKYVGELLEAIRTTRGQLAVLHGCKPHTVATGNAMQQLTELRPLTVDELKDAAIDGFSEAKIKKFGQPLVDCIRRKVQELPTMQQVLRQFPLMTDKITFFQITSWTLFKEGRSVAEIGNFRRLPELQIYQHLADAIRHGLDFDWPDFERIGLSRPLYEEIRVKLPPSLDSVDLTVVKKDCSACITLGQIVLVLGHVHVRSHLAGKDLLYREEQSTLQTSISKQLQQKARSDGDQGGEDDGMSASLKAEEDFYGFPTSTSSDVVDGIDDDE